jgi:hypothetical protein
MMHSISTRPVHARTIAVYDVYLTRCLALLAAFCTLSVFLYGIFLLMAVAHTAARSEAGRQVDAITANLGDMEAQYLAAQRSITPERAQALGLVKPTEVSTVYSTASNHTLTLNRN